MAEQRLILALGANMPSIWGAPPETFLHVLGACADYVGLRLAELSVSDLYQTPAWPDSSRAPYANAVFSLSTSRPAAEVLAFAHSLEATAGRKRGARNADRPLDIDLIACGDDVLPDRQTWRRLSDRLGPAEALPELMVPHPRLQQRAFVLVPFFDVAPDWRHPLYGLNVDELKSQLLATDVSAVVRLRQWCAATGWYLSEDGTS